MNPDRPLVSIGVPVYNGARTLPACLDSLLGQSYSKIDIIICDNASTDGTAQVCEGYAARDRRIRYYRNHSNIGAILNFRRVLDLSRGEFFTWAPADDIRPPEAIARCVDALIEKPRAAMAHGPLLIRRPNDTSFRVVPNQAELTQARAAARVAAFTREISHNSMLFGLYRRSSLERAVLGRHCGQDYLLVLQMCYLGQIEYVETPIVVYTERKPAASRMYAEAPITLGSLLKVRGVQRHKCWTVLCLGCYYGLTRSGVGISDRVTATWAHIRGMFRMYPSRLAKELLFQLFEPVSRLALVSWNFLRHRRQGLWLARRLRTIAPSVAPREMFG